MRDKQDTQQAEDLDETLAQALRSYAAPAERPGLERRMLARIPASSARNKGIGIWRWGSAAAAVLLCCLLVPFSHRHVETRSAPSPHFAQRATLPRPSASYRTSARERRVSLSRAVTRQVIHPAVSVSVAVAISKRPFAITPLSTEEGLLLQLAARPYDPLPVKDLSLPIVIAPNQISAITIKLLPGSEPSNPNSN